MAEVIGIIAAAFQLAGACMRLLETIRKIKGSSKTLKRYQNQLQDLRDLSATITQNPILQTPEVKAHTQSLLALISEHNFETLLRKPRLLRNLQFLNTQRELLDIFDTIEKGKTSLSLVILSIQAKALDQIRVDVKSMAKPGRLASQGPHMGNSAFAGERNSGPVALAFINEVLKDGRLGAVHWRPVATNNGDQINEPTYLQGRCSCCKTHDTNILL